MLMVWKNDNKWPQWGISNKYPQCMIPCWNILSMPMGVDSLTNECCSGSILEKVMTGWMFFFSID